MPNEDPTIPESGPETSPEPEQRPEPKTPRPRPAPPPPKAGFIAPLFGGVLAAGIGFGLSHFDVLKLRPAADDAAIRSELDALGSVVAKLRGDLDAQAAAQAAALESGLAAAKSEAAAAAAAAGEDSKAALQTLAALPDQVAALSAKVDAFDAALASAANTTSSGSVSQATIVALSNALESLRAEVEGVKSAAAEPSDPETLRQMAREEMAAWEAANLERVRAEEAAAELAAKRAAALAALHQAAESGAPFAAELTALGDVAVPEIVTRYAETGIPSLDGLAKSFPASARAALEASLRAQAGEGLGDRVWSFLRVQTGARSLVPREGSDPDAVLSRAEAALREARVADALTELAALPPEGQAEMAGWVAQAQDHLSATQALATLNMP